MGWDVSVIALDRCVSNKEFNDFCFRNNAIDAYRHLDTPNEDIIAFDFNLMDCSIATRVYKCRDRDVKERSGVDLGAEEIAALHGPIAAIVYIEITGKFYSKQDYLNYLSVVDLLMTYWGGIHRDFQEIMHTQQSIKSQIGIYSQHN